MKRRFAAMAIVAALCATGVLVVSGSGPKPLGKMKLLALVAGRALPENVVREIGEDGLRFHPDEAYRWQLENAGADQTVLKAVEAAKVVVSPSREDKTDPKMLQHVSDAGRFISENWANEASDELNAVLDGGKKSTEARFVMGQVFCQNERWAQAADAYREVLREDSGFPEAHAKLSYILHRLGDQESALREAKAALNATPDNAEAHKNAGMALAAMRRFNAATAEFREAIRIKPDYEAAHAEMGTMYDAQGDWKNAAAEYTKAIALDPNDTDARDHLANSLKLDAQPHEGAGSHDAAQAN